MTPAKAAISPAQEPAALTTKSQAILLTSPVSVLRTLMPTTWLLLCSIPMIVVYVSTRPPYLRADATFCQTIRKPSIAASGTRYTDLILGLRFGSRRRASSTEMGIAGIPTLAHASTHFPSKASSSK